VTHPFTLPEILMLPDEGSMITVACADWNMLLNP
jgi:hypothetical protein